MKRILYMTDRYGVSQGYEPAFTKMLARVGIPRQAVKIMSIYRDVDSPLAKRGNEKTWKFNPAKLQQIRQSFDDKIRIVKPSVIVVSDPAVLGVIVNGDLSAASLEKTRGGSYSYRGIPVIILYPITVIHQRVLVSYIKDDEGDEIVEQPYRASDGAWILNRDWEKVARFFHGKTRNLPRFSYSVCRTREDLEVARQWAADSLVIAVDIETGVWPPQQTCVGFAIMTKNWESHTFVIPYYDPTRPDGVFWESEDDHLAAWETARFILSTPALKVMQNGSYDCSYFIRDRTPPNNYLLDTMVAWWSLFPELPKSLDFITSILQDGYQYWKDDIKGIDNKDLTSKGMETYWRYNAQDCYTTLFNGLFLMQMLQRDEKMLANYRSAFFRVVAGLGMSMRGVRADFRRRNEHKESLTRERDEAVARLRWLIDDQDFNHNSPQQKVALLYDVLGARPRDARGRFTKSAPSSGAIALKAIKTEHPVFKRVVEAIESAQEPDKQISNVCNMFLYSNRFRTSYQAVGTETGRFSSKSSNFWDGGNAQNIRSKYRDWLVADPDCILMEIDYSQSDDVFISYEANDPEKIKTVESGLDAHAVNGELFFGVSYDEIVAGKKAKDPRIIHPTKGIRSLTKRVVHGANFIMAAMTLYMTMGREAVVSAAEHLGHGDASRWNQEQLVLICDTLMKKYRGKHRRLTHKGWYGDLVREMTETGGLTNAFGFHRKFLGDPKDSGTQREGAAHIGQSDTAYNMNRCMDEIIHGYIPANFRDGANPSAGEAPRKMDWKSHGFSFLLQTHDSFTIQFDLTHPKWKEAATNVLHVMERPIIIRGHTMRVRTESEFMTEWGGFKLPWDGDPASLDSIAETLSKRRAERN